MFGIGLPEMILIMALALIVVGPDKLPDLARSLAKGLMDLKKTAESLKSSFAEQDNPLSEIRPELEDAAKSLKNDLLDIPPYERDTPSQLSQVIQPAERAAEAYQELMKHASSSPSEQQTLTDIPLIDDTQTSPLGHTKNGEKPVDSTESKKSDQ